MNKAQLDRLFDAAFDAADSPGGDNPTVDHRASWQRVQRRLNARRRRSSMRSALSKLAIVAASLVLGALLFGNNRVVKAIEPIYATIKEYPSGMMNLIFGRPDETDSSKAKTSPPPAHLEGLSFDRLNDSTIAATVTETQAGDLLSFRAPAFGYLPEGFSFDKALLYFYDGKDKADYGIFIFASDQGEKMTVVMQKVDSNTVLGGKNSSGAASVQSLRLGEGPAVLTIEENKNGTLETIRNGIHYSISGQFAGEVLFRVFEDIKW